MIGLCNSSSNCWSDIFSFLMPSPEVFLSKIYKLLKQDPFDIHHILDFSAVLNALSHVFIKSP